MYFIFLRFFPLPPPGVYSALSGSNIGDIADLAVPDFFFFLAAFPGTLRSQQVEFRNLEVSLCGRASPWGWILSFAAEGGGEKNRKPPKNNPPEKSKKLPGKALGWGEAAPMNFLCFWGAGLHFGGARRDSINSGSWWGFGGKAPPGLCGERSRERGWEMPGMVGKGRNRPRLRRGAAGDPRRYRPRAALPARHRGGGGRGRGRSRQSLPKIPSRGFFFWGGAGSSRSEPRADFPQQAGDAGLESIASSSHLRPSPAPLLPPPPLFGAVLSPARAPGSSPTPLGLPGVPGAGRQWDFADTTRGSRPWLSMLITACLTET